MSKILREQRLDFHSAMTLTWEMLLISLIPTEADKFQHMNFTVDLMPLEFIALMKKLIYLSLDTIQVVIEELVQVNLIKLSLPTMVLLVHKFLEDHPIILQDHSWETIVSKEELPQKTVQCGEPILELKMQLKALDKDLLLDQDSMLMKHSTPLIWMDQDLLAPMNCNANFNHEDTS